jgi:acetylornithine deacetylase
LPGDDPDDALRGIQDAVVDLPPWSVEVTRGAFMYPSEVGADCAVASAVRRASRAFNGQEGEVFYSPAALDAGYLNQRGIETIMFGPGDLRFAHTDEEVVSVQEVRDAARIYAATALELLA